MHNCFSCKFFDELDIKIFHYCVQCKKHYCENCEFLPKYLDYPNCDFYCSKCIINCLRAICPY